MASAPTARATASFSFRWDSFFANEISALRQSTTIDSIRYASSLPGPGRCTAGDEGATEFFVEGTNVPVRFQLGLMMAGEGFLKARAANDAEHFGSITAGVRDRNRPERYASVQISGVRFGIEWNFNGVSGYGGQKYLFIDTGGGSAQTLVKVRWDTVGLSLNTGQLGGVTWDNLQLRVSLTWEDAAKAQALNHIPLEINGAGTWASPSGPPKGEVFLLNRWYKVELPRWK